MASRTREDRIIKSTACPDCGAGAGEPCHLNWRVKADNKGKRLMVHSGRREAWRASRASQGGTSDSGRTS
jgi:hypothetical protein